MRPYPGRTGILAGDTAQSWANQALAAKFARILDAHPNYNIWDARQHLRQAASFWASGWTETNGYGRVNERAVVGKLLPGPPVEFMAARSHDRRQVIFTWRNFLQTGFAATVIARKDGPVLYEGTGTNFVWTSDVDGDATFRYWSKNKAGEKSRMESYQTRTVTGLNCRRNQTCLVLGAAAGQEALTRALGRQFEHVAPNWVCDVVCRPAPAGQGQAAPPAGPPGMIVLPDFAAMVSYAISNRYHLLIAPISIGERDLYAFKSEWDRATAAGILVVVPNSSSLKLRARRPSPPRLSSAVVVGAGVTNAMRSFGPGLEFIDAPTGPGFTLEGEPQVEAAVVAGKLAQILDANPHYNIWDARQHLRQSASFYPAGWREDGGYGRPPAQPAKIAVLDPAPPLDVQAAKSADGDLGHLRLAELPAEQLRRDSHQADGWSRDLPGDRHELRLAQRRGGGSNLPVLLPGQSGPAVPAGGLHGSTGPVTECRAAWWNPAGIQRVQVVRRWTLWTAAWSVGLTSSSSMLTCGGRLATQTRMSAMSSAVSGWVPS